MTVGALQSLKMPPKVLFVHTYPDESGRRDQGPLPHLSHLDLGGPEIFSDDLKRGTVTANTIIHHQLLD
jgi:hypothetical protein